MSGFAVLERRDQCCIQGLMVQGQELEVLPWAASCTAGGAWL